MTYKKRKRIAVTRLLPVLDFGGVESRVVLQSQMMDRERFDLRVCAFWSDGEAADAIRRAGVPVDILDVDPAVRNPVATVKLAAYLRQHDPDILHASIGEANFHGLIAGTLAQVPHRVVEEVGIPSRSDLAQFIFGHLYGLASRVVGVSKATCRVLRDEGATEQQLELIYNCANPKFFEGPMPRREEAPPVEFLIVGRLVEVKNQATVLRAFRRVIDEVPQARLRIAGEGELRGELEALVDSLGLREHVEFLGFCDDIKSLLQSSHVFLLPSHSEGCSISLVEAMSSGIVPLGSTADGISEVMGALGEEFQIDAADVEGWREAMLRCATMSDDERRSIGERAREIAFERFSPNVYIENVATLYRDVTNTSSN